MPPNYKRVATLPCEIYIVSIILFKVAYSDAFEVWWEV